MDISKISHGIKVVLGGSIAFLIVSIFNWQEIDFEGIASRPASACGTAGACSPASSRS